MRQISGLISASALPARPKSIPLSRPRGAKAMGLRYERALAWAMPMASHGKWFEFRDRNGPGYCQVDVLLEMPRSVLILEAKYTWVPEGHCQVERLYEPVVAKALGKPARGLVVTKRLVPDMAPGIAVAGTLLDAAKALASGQRVVLHWLGNSPLLVDYAKLAIAA